MQELIRLDELKNLFFYTFGIVPLQYYNVIGDGMTDNRLKLQQAIYDAIEIGARYIFVPRGEYYYSNQLFKANEVVFIGNEKAKIEGIEIEQFPEFTPLAGIIVYAGTNIPSNYLECNGQEVNTDSYKNLYAELNNITLDEETELPKTFNLPNLTAPSGTKYIIRAK